MDENAPPDGDTTTAPRVLAICAILLLIALIAFSLRLYTRLCPIYKLLVEDYMIALAVVREHCAMIPEVDCPLM